MKPYMKEKRLGFAIGGSVFGEGGSVLPRSLDIAVFASQDKYVVKCDAICVIDARGGKETA